MANVINAVKEGTKKVWNEVSPEAGYAVSGIIRLTKIGLHSIGDVTNGTASAVELSVALADGFSTAALGGTTQAQRIAGANSKGERLYGSLFGDEKAAADAPLTLEEQELLKELIAAEAISQEQVEALSSRGLRALMTLIEESAEAAAAAAGL